MTIGYNIASELHSLRNLLPGILYHHERYDGGGYPEGLQGEAIPILARILAVADAYDAMTTNRPNRKVQTHHRAGEILAEGAGRQWDKTIVDAFFKCRDKIDATRKRGASALGETIEVPMPGKGSTRLFGKISLTGTTANAVAPSPILLRSR